MSRGNRLLRTARTASVSGGMPRRRQWQGVRGFEPNTLCARGSTRMHGLLVLRIGTATGLPHTKDRCREDGAEVAPWQGAS